MTELPRYPLYIPSKGRFGNPLTLKAFQRDEVPVHVVIEESELDEYEARWVHPPTTFLTLPFSNAGSVIPARNWIMEHSIEHYGSARHWQFDDNSGRFYRYYKGRKIPLAAHAALRIVEDFTDRYKNVAVSGMDYDMFCPRGIVQKPFLVNHKVYSASLHNNAVPFRWRGRYNEDVDWCLQALSTGYWVTILVKAVMVEKRMTMGSKGGNTDELYAGDGRAEMARSLERLWPGVVKTARRYGRPQHRIAYEWRRFQQPLIPVDNPEPIPDYALTLTGTPQSRSLREALDL